MSSIYDWSLVAPENARTDKIINWAEGQPPSTVNDSARAMMQRVREYLADNGGDIEAKFTINHDEKNTLINLNTKSDFSMYTNGIVLRFKAQSINVGATFVTLNQLKSQPVYKVIQGGIRPLTGGEIQSGGIYELVYYFDLAGKDLDGWYLTNPTISIAHSFPPGFIATFAMKDVPEGWLVCDGKAYRRKEYPLLFLAVGETWGNGDGRNTFNVPDFRGMFLRGLDAGRGVDIGRLLGSNQADSFKSHTHTGKTDFSGDHKHATDDIQIVGTCASGTGRARYLKTNEKVDTTNAGNHMHTIHLDATGDEETRPVNVAVVYAIKT
ncbi:phage tail protein [Bartonella sp. B10]